MTEQTSHTTIPGIRSISWVASSGLPRGLALSALCGDGCTIYSEMHPIGFIGFPECKVRAQRSGAGMYETATLTFVSRDTFPIEEKISIVVEDIMGHTFLIGGREPPFPEFKVDRTFSHPGGDPAVHTYEVTHTSLRALIACKQ